MSIHIYAYYGKDLSIDYVLRIDRFKVFPELAPAPGPDFRADEQSHVWVHYAGVKQLRKPKRRDDFREVSLQGQSFGDTSHPIGEPGWLQMYRTGIIFVEDPEVG